jgi:hypothetical protein
MRYGSEKHVSVRLVGISEALMFEDFMFLWNFVPAGCSFCFTFSIAFHHTIHTTERTTTVISRQ